MDDQRSPKACTTERPVPKITLVLRIGQTPPWPSTAVSRLPESGADSEDPRRHVVWGFSVRDHCVRVLVTTRVSQSPLYQHSRGHTDR